MLIEYVATKSKRNVPDHIGETLVARSIARRVEQTAAIQTREIRAEEEVEISPRTGKPKRRYKRRDMQAEGIEE